MIERPAGVILAGGLSRRMGGGDKALLPLGRGRLIDLVLARLRPQCGAIAINANGDPSRFADLGLPVIADSVPDFAGPLAGVLAGLDWAAAQDCAAIVTVAADTPFIPQDLVDRLGAAAGPSGLAIAATRGGDGLPDRHPTFGLWPVALREDLRRALAEGLRKIVHWTDRHGAGIAEFDIGAADPFFNVNTPADLAAAALRAGAAE